jgi:hypothetical protein
MQLNETCEVGGGGVRQGRFRKEVVGLSRRRIQSDTRFERGVAWIMDEWLMMAHDM